MDSSTSTYTTFSNDDTQESLLDILKRVHKDSVMFATKCKKPDKKEFLQMVRMISVGFGIMGFMGLFAKLVFLPIHAIIS